MATTTKSEDRRVAGLKRAGLSADLSGYTDEQLAAAAEVGLTLAAGNEISERKAREQIMGNGSGKAEAKPGTVKRTPPARGKSMRTATIEVLKRAKGPLHTSEIAKRVLADPEVKTNGKTPEASIAARLAVGAKRGEFVRTAPGTFTLPGKGGK